jgi:uncharacterized ubiquitin-like protein YukD
VFASGAYKNFALQVALSYKIGFGVVKNDAQTQQILDQNERTREELEIIIKKLMHHTQDQFRLRLSGIYPVEMILVGRIMTKNIPKNLKSLGKKLKHHTQTQYRLRLSQIYPVEVIFVGRVMTKNIPIMKS